MAGTTLRLDYESLAVCSEKQPQELAAVEAALIEGLQSGREEAYEVLISHYQQPVYSLVYRLMEDPAATADVVQEVFLKVFRHIRSFRGQSSLRTWIYRIAVNEAHNHQRWYSRHRKREVGFDGGEEEGAGRNYEECVPDPGGSPYELALREETLALIEEALSRLKPIFRTAVVLRDIEDLSYEEITEILGVSMGTVKSRILRGREALRKELEQRLEHVNTVKWSPQTAIQD